MSTTKKVAGVFCYKDESQYNELLAIFTDAHNLPTTFGRWEQLNDKTVKTVEGSGVIAIRVYAESAEEFVEFCRLHGKSLDTEGRRHFANLKAFEYSQSH